MEPAYTASRGWRGNGNSLKLGETLKVICFAHVDQLHLGEAADEWYQLWAEQQLWCERDCFFLSGCFTYLLKAAAKFLFKKLQIKRSAHTSSCGIHLIYNLVWMPKTCEYCLPQNYQWNLFNIMKKQIISWASNTPQCFFSLTDTFTPYAFYM